MPRASASPTAASGSLYFVRGVNIMVVPVSGGTAHKITKVGNGSVTGMTIASGKVFWVTLTGQHDTLSFAAKNGGSAHVLVRNLNTPRGLVSADGWLFWVDQNAIGRVRPNGTGSTASSSSCRRRPAAASPMAWLPTATICSSAAARATRSAGSTCPAPTRACRSSSSRTRPARRAWLSVTPIVYWADLAGFVGRSTLTGHGANGSWLNIRAAGQGPFNVAADNAHVFWDWGGAAGSPVHVGRATVSGTGLNKNFLTGQGAFALTSPGANS